MATTTYSFLILPFTLTSAIVLLTNDLVAKVSDFGLSRLNDGSSVVYSKSDIGPLKWMSVEALQKKKFSEKSDGMSSTYINVHSA